MTGIRVSGTSGEGRRHDDHDWRVSAPRWFLLSTIIVLLGVMPLFGGLALFNIREHIAFTQATAAKVEAIQADAAVTRARVAAQEQATSAMCEDIRETRIDMLSWQAIQARRQGLVETAEEFSGRLDQAKRRAARNGCWQHPPPAGR